MAKKVEEAQALANPGGEKMVRIMLHRDNNEHRGDMFVGVNMQDYHVPRGMPVEVPESVAGVIANMLEQEQEAFEFQEANQNVKLN